MDKNNGYPTNQVASEGQKPEDLKPWRSLTTEEALGKWLHFLFQKLFIWNIHLLSYRDEGTP